MGEGIRIDQYFQHVFGKQEMDGTLGLVQAFRTCPAFRGLEGWSRTLRPCACRPPDIVQLGEPAHEMWKAGGGRILPLPVLCVLRGEVTVCSGFHLPTGRPAIAGLLSSCDMAAFLCRFLRCEGQERLPSSLHCHCQGEIGGDGPRYFCPRSSPFSLEGT